MSSDSIQISVYCDPPVIRRNGIAAPLAGKDQEGRELSSPRVARALLRVLVLLHPLAVSRPTFRDADDGALSPETLNKAVSALRQRLGSNVLITLRNEQLIALQDFVVTDHEAVLRALDAGDRRAVLELTYGGRGSTDAESYLTKMPNPSGPSGSLFDAVEAVEKRVSMVVDTYVKEASAALDAGDAARAVELTGWLEAHPYANRTRVRGLVDRLRAARLPPGPPDLNSSTGLRQLASQQSSQHSIAARDVRGMIWSHVRSIERSEFGVTLAHPSHGFRDPHGPKIERQVDGMLGEMIAEARRAEGPTVIAVVGPSGAGKSRVARDALIETCPGSEIVIPDDSARLGRALDADLLTQSFPSDGRVLYLDDVELFVAPDGLTAKRLRTLKRRAVPLVVLLTAGGKGPELLAPDTRDLRAAHLAGTRELWDQRIDLDVSLTAQEIASAPLLPRIKTRIAKDGLTWITGAGRLRDKLSYGRHHGSSVHSPEGQGLVRLVLEWHASGVPMGIGGTALHTLMRNDTPSLASHEIEAALRWALKPVGGTIALLYRRHDGHEFTYEADDYVRTASVWHQDGDVDYARWSMMTGSLSAVERLAILRSNGAQYYLAKLADSPEEHTFWTTLDALRSEMMDQEVSADQLAELDVLRADAYEECVREMWEPYPTSSENSAQWEARLVDLYRQYVAAAERAAATGASSHLFRWAEIGAPPDSRAQRTLVRRAFDACVSEGGSVREPIFVSAPGDIASPAARLLRVGLSQHLLGELGAAEDTLATLDAATRETELLAPYALDDLRSFPIQVLRAYIAHKRGSSPPPWSEQPSNETIDWGGLAEHLFSVGEIRDAMACAEPRQASTSMQVRCLVELGEERAALRLLGAVQLAMLDGSVPKSGNDLLTADVLALMGMRSQQLALLRKAIDGYEPTPPLVLRSEADRWDEAGEPIYDAVEARRETIRLRNALLIPRFVDAALLLENIHGAQAAESFLRLHESEHATLRLWLADLLFRTGRPVEADAILNRRSKSIREYPSVWARQFSVDHAPGLRVFPWDARWRRVELPGYDCGAQRIVTRAVTDGQSLQRSFYAVVSLGIRAAHSADWDLARGYARRAIELYKPWRTAWSRRVYSLPSNSEADHLFYLGTLLRHSGFVKDAIAIFETCSEDHHDGAAEALAAVRRA